MKLKKPAIQDVLRIMARLRAPDGCPWDREQSHHTLRHHAIEEVYELIDAIEAGDDHEMIEELGDVLLQVVFHCQMGKERGVFDFDTVCRQLAGKLLHRHPHVFGDAKVKNVEAVWAQWEQIKKAEKKGTRHERASALDGVPKHLPALLRVEKLVKKARKAKLITDNKSATAQRNRTAMARELFDLAAEAQRRGWSAEELLMDESKRRENQMRRQEKIISKKNKSHD